MAVESFEHEHKEFSSPAARFFTRQVGANLMTGEGEQINTVNFRVIPANVEPKDALGFLIFAKRNKMYVPENGGAVGFIRYVAQGARFQDKEGRSNSAESILKMHLLDFEPIDRAKLPRRLARQEMLNAKIPDTTFCTKQEKDLMQKVEKLKVSYYMLLDAETYDNWTLRILTSLENISRTKDLVDAPILCVYPKSSVFLTNAVKAMGGRHIESIVYKGEKLNTEKLPARVAVMMIDPKDISSEHVQEFIRLAKVKIERRRARHRILRTEYKKQAEELQQLALKSKRLKSLAKVLAN